MRPKRYASLPPVPVVVETPASTGSYGPTNSQCVKCKKWKNDALLYNVWNNVDHVNEKMCWLCKKEEYEKGGQKAKKLCDNCGEHPSSGMLYIIKNKNLCFSCCSKEHKSNKPAGGVIFACYECGIKTSEMKAGDTLKYIDGQLYCNGCASLFNVSDKEKLPEKCWVCHKVIPKDHIIIMRYGTQICEECACPSDVRGDYSEFHGDAEVC